MWGEARYSGAAAMVSSGTARRIASVGPFCCLRHDYVAFDLADFPGSLVFNLPGFRLKFGSDLFKHDAIGVIADIPLASRSS